MSKGSSHVKDDDLRPEFFCYGLEKMVTPNFDRLAQRVDHPALERVADRHLQHLAGPDNIVAFTDLLAFTEQHHAENHEVLER